MRLPLTFSRAGLYGLAAVAFVALLALWHDTAPATVGRVAGGVVLGWMLADIARSMVSWRRAPLQWQRRLPAALALGVPHTLSCALVNDGPNDWWVELADRVDPGIDVQGLPLQIYVPARSRVELSYNIVPRRRGLVLFKPAQLRVRTLHGSFEWQRHIGQAQTLRVHADFAAVSRHAALVRVGRLGEAGMTGSRRPAREHERGQCVMFLLDCSARMRDDGMPARRGQRFDAALNGLMLLARVALSEGDEVGAMSFGTDVRLRRRLAPRKGAAAWQALMRTFHDMQPEASPSDYRQAARELMQLRSKRSLVVLLTRVHNDERSGLDAALALLRTRHLVLVIDAGQPRRLAAELVNRYRDAKASGRL